MAREKKQFVSNVTGEEWHKHNSKRWNKVINQVGVVLEDEVHEGKNGSKVTLKKGTRVIIDDIRGRIKPQYRVKDQNGKIWFISALNIEIPQVDTTVPDPTEHEYRGGVRIDGTDDKRSPDRYSLSQTTEEEVLQKKMERRAQKNG